MLSPSFIVNYNCVYFSLMLSDGIVKINFLKTAKESLSIVAEREVSMFFIEARRIAIVILSSLLLAVSLNFFLINANVYASGFTGAAQLVSSVFKDFLGVQVSTGILLFLFNIPVQDVYTDYGTALGIAFQLRDDVLGVFSDPD